jgi:hypothetical protein
MQPSFSDHLPNSEAIISQKKSEAIKKCEAINGLKFF